jgi:oligosaccharyltransferase complex subunit gamma
MWGTVVFFILSGALSIRFLAPVLRNRWTWAVITILTSLIMTSGYMFTRIRGMPTTASDGSWIAQGFQTQYGQETTVVATLCMSPLRVGQQPLTPFLQMVCYRLLS